MGNEFARKNMWDSDYRPEQLFARDFLAIFYPNWKIKTEYPVRDLKLDGEPYRKCVLDIAVLEPKKIAIRLNGGYHFSSEVQRTKDEYQKEALRQAGWVVIDFNHYEMPNLFKKKKNKETIKFAKLEILEYLD